MVYDVTMSMAMIPFDLVLLLNLYFNHKSTADYHRAMRHALCVLIASAAVDVVCGLLSHGGAGADTELSLSGGTGAVLTVMHLTAAAFVAAFIALYVIELRAQRKEGTSGILLTMPQRLLLSASLPALLLVVCYQLFSGTRMLVTTCYLSFLTIAFYFVTELPVHDQLRRRLAELSRAVNQAKEAQEHAAEEDLDQNDFLTNMSHEIRTPLNAILGMDEMILRTCRDEKVSGYARDIRDAGNSLLAIINDILDFSRIETGTLETAHAPYHFAAVLENVWNMMQLRAQDKGIELVREVDDALPDLLEGDGQRLSQILINLLNNAIKYTNKGSVTLRVCAVEHPEQEAFTDADRPGWVLTDTDILLRIDVIDTGIGIRAEDLSKLFDSFARFDTERNRNVEGTGLGLTITHNLVRLMDGDIRVSSMYGEGSTFTVFLPQRVLDKRTVAEYVREENRDRSGETRRFFAPEAHVLLVDDTPSNLRVVEALLRQTQVRTDTCLSGAEALSLMSHHVYDAVLLDHMMPEMDGIEAFHAMRAQDGFDGEKTKIIVLTANAIAGAREMYLAEGFDDYLSKPVESVRLEETLMKHLPGDKVITASDPRYTDLLARAQEKRAMEELSQAQSGQEDLEVLRNLKGIDLDAALKICSDASLLKTTMLDFAESIDEEAELIEDYLAARDWKNYTIKVHALKSTARMIGAMELSDDARLLEGCGNAENEAEILERTPKLVADYRAYQEYLAPLLRLEAAEDDNREEVPLDELYDAYDALREFVEAHDFDSADYIMETLAGYRIPDEERARYDVIRRAVRRVDREKLLKILGEA